MTGLATAMDPGLDVSLIMTAGTVGGIGRRQCSAMGVGRFRMAGIGKVGGQGHMTFRTVSGAGSQVIRSAVFQGSVRKDIGMAEGTIGNSIISMDGDHNIAGTMTTGTLRCGTARYIVCMVGITGCAVMGVKVIADAGMTICTILGHTLDMSTC